MILDGNPEFGVELAADRLRQESPRPAGRAATRSSGRRMRRRILRQALAQPAGHSVVQAVVDPNEPPMPGKITTGTGHAFREGACARAKRTR